MFDLWIRFEELFVVYIKFKWYSVIGLYVNVFGELLNNVIILLNIFFKYYWFFCFDCFIY